MQVGSVREGRALLSIRVRFSTPSHFVISCRGLKGLRQRQPCACACVRAEAGPHH